MRPRLLSLCCALLLGAACKGPPARKIALRDSEGRKLEATCTKQGACEVAQVAGPRWPGERQQLTLQVTERLMGVCNATNGGVLAPADCRLLECGSDAECPPADGMEHGTCVEGLCTVPTHETGQLDVVMLCMSGTGLGTETPIQAERAALALNCGSPCKRPDPCRKP